MDKKKILQMVCILAAIIVLASGLSKAVQKNSLSLADYASLQENTLPETTKELLPPLEQSSAENDISSAISTEFKEIPSDNMTEILQKEPMQETVTSLLTGAILNSKLPSDERVQYAEGFYYEPIGDNLRRYITGISFPSDDPSCEAKPPITIEQLRYLHILHYDFEGNQAEGELICNEAIAKDLIEIFYELYQNEYQLETVLLIDEFDGDDLASMKANNTSCFNYRVVEGSSTLSMHAYGLAIDINPLYNPYITYEKDGTVMISPKTSSAYADRTVPFPYKIDENDLCYKLFIQHGFTWGGNWNHVKDYQHFQKANP